MENLATYISAILLLSLLSCNGKISDSPSTTNRGVDTYIPLRLLFKQNGDNGKYGYLDRNGKIVIEPQFNSPELFYRGFATVKIAEDEYAVIDVNGKMLKFPHSYRQSIVTDGMISICISKEIPGKGYDDVRYGYVDLSGKVVIEPKFIKEWWGFSEGLAGVAIHEKEKNTSRFCSWDAFYIDKSGKTVIPGPFDECGGFHEGFARVRFGDRWRYIDKKGRFLNTTSYESAQDFSEGMVVVCEDRLYGYINTKGKLCIPYKFNGARPFSEGLAQVWERNKTGVGMEGFIDKSGKYVVEPQFTYTNAFSEGLAFAIEEDEDNNTTWSGFIDKKGNRVLTIKGCHAGLEFEQGLCAVWITTGRSEENVEDEIVYINKSGQIVVKAPPNCRLVEYNPWED